MSTANATSSLARLLADSQRIVFLTGAGMSTESGIPDFRSPNGLYAKLGGQSLFEISHFLEDPGDFYRTGVSLFEKLWRAKPNAGHLAIAALAGLPGKHVTVVTQNIDVLHQQAGSPTVFPVHGTIETCTCQECWIRCSGEEVWERAAAGELPPRHDCGGILKPDVVFFGDPLPYRVFAAAEDAIRAADLLVVAGTSLVVYPAAGLPDRRRPDCRLAIVNHTPTDLDPAAELVLRENVGTALAAAVKALGLP